MAQTDASAHAAADTGALPSREHIKSNRSSTEQPGNRHRPARHHRIEHRRSARNAPERERCDMDGRSRKRTLDVSESLLRLAMWSRTEVRIDLPNYLGGWAATAIHQG